MAMPNRETRVGDENAVANSGIAGVKHLMSVIASCGKKIGVVDCIEGNAIKLMTNHSPDGRPHFIPIGWIDRVDIDVHLRKNAKETQRGWHSDAASCQCEWVLPVVSSGFDLSVDQAPEPAAVRASRSAEHTRPRAGLG